MEDATRPTLAEDQQRLARDMRAIVDDAEQLLRHAVANAGEGYAQARARLEQSVGAAKARLEDAEQGVRRAGAATDRYVRDHAWESIGVGAAVGFIVGLLVRRR